jgi:hypothetical protein
LFPQSSTFTRCFFIGVGRMASQSSYSRHVPWADKEPGNAGAHPRSSAKRPQNDAEAHKRRRLRSGSLTLTAALFVGAGLGAGGLMFSDRLATLSLSKDWIEPSAAWMASLNDRGHRKPGREAKVESAVLITPSPASLAAEPSRRSEAESLLAAAASNDPATTSSLGTASAINGRDLPWLPETERREALESSPMSPLARVAVASPDVAPIASPRALSAPNMPIASEVADLIKKARGHIELGDIAGARLWLERAAAGHEPTALMALAETYDPAMLSKWGTRGLKGDPAKARALYQKAAESGIAEARARILALR